MTFKLIPQVLNTSPGNGNKDIPTLSSIRVTFNVDLHQQHLTNGILVNYIETSLVEGPGINDPKIISQLVSLPGAITHADRVLVFTPTEGFRPGMTYYVTILSNGTTRQGVRSILGDFMPSNYTFSFSTADTGHLSPVVLFQPENGSVVRTISSLSWRGVSRTKYYKVEISRSNTFQPILWESPPIGSTSITLEPSVLETDGIYYWRVQAFGWRGETSEQSGVFQFNLDRSEVATVVPEDEPILDPATPNILDSGFDVIETYPQENFSNVALNLKTIYIRVRGDFDITKLTRNFLNVFGRAVNDTDESHEAVNGAIEIIDLGDGTKIITFTPAVLQKV